MKVRLWGVRGSIPSPGAETAKYGGNTSCVELITDSGEIIIIDSGTGIRQFGMDYLRRKKRSNAIHILISHVHWDHIQGFPFFAPAHLPDLALNIYSGVNIRKYFVSMMTPPCFPLKFDTLRSKPAFHVIGESGIEVAGCMVKPFAVIHPQETYGFRIEENGKTVVYSSDTELEAGKNYSAITKGIRGADVLLFDSQYTPEEYSGGRAGWGHSTYEVAVETAKKAGVGKLVLFHHDPAHDDKTIDRIERKARALFPATIAAREGTIIKV
jgi:phosphoribosyl 1,2-cyclic phosphodiesterase